MHSTGILLALGALVFWTFGDFFIQRSVRRVGDWKTLFYIAAFGAVVLLPFVLDDIPQVLRDRGAFVLLTETFAITLLVAVVEFEALRRGKLGVVEPIMGAELPITVGLAVFIGQEVVRVEQLFLMAVVFLGIVFAVTRRASHLHYHRRLFEPGVLLAATAAVLMALVNFLTGTASQVTSPLLTIWFVHACIALVAAAYLAARGELRSVRHDLRTHLGAILPVSVFDNAAWVSYATAVTLIPISVAITISESYIAFAALLGITVNRERLRPHQYVGVALAVLGAIALAWVSR